MKLSKRLLFFSIGLALVLMLFFLLYFSLLLPGLYEANQKSETVRLAKELHEGYVQERNYQKLKVENHLSNFSVVIPLEGYDLKFSNKAGDAIIKVESASLQKLVDKIRTLYTSKAYEDMDRADIEDFFSSLELPSVEGVQIEFKANKIEVLETMDTSSDYYSLEDGALIVNQLKQDSLTYLSIIAISKLEDEIIMTMIPTIVDSWNKIWPVAMGSLPMILLVILLITILSSQYLAKSVILPIQMIQNHTNMLKNRPPNEWTNLNLAGKDELAALSQRLDEVHAELRHNYENINAEKERQALFVKASSHELKTPLASALLLCDSMIGKIGKYADVESYLPELRKILLSMQKMLQEILLMRTDSDTAYAELDFVFLAQSIAEQNAIFCEEKNLKIEISGSLVQKTWIDLAHKVLENLIGNAVRYGETGTKISLHFTEQGFSLRNAGHIEESILANIFEPFVTGGGSQGHGLGLYIVKSYAKILKWKIAIENIEKEKGVLVTCKTKQ